MMEEMQRSGGDGLMHVLVFTLKMATTAEPGPGPNQELPSRSEW